MQVRLDAVIQIDAVIDADADAQRNHRQGRDLDADTQHGHQRVVEQ